MNSKQAKRVRRLAEEVFAEMEKTEPEGTYKQHRSRGYIINAPNSLRGIVRRIKKEASARTLTD